ncbi:hypothetical protein AVEN_117167-1 [Araneus ventricosus]|uniref:Uncharacterized protein n=1 Tax=Araneus ventricosus TaxID=182803 RepID=A0A4Y2AX28_ARAVE|nr:hypothetical protein AVEN_117167-1 [Araneus ventricosus]
MKQFIKSLPKYGECFRYLCSKFLILSEAELKDGVFTGPDIRKLLSDSHFSETMGDREKEARDSFKDVLHSEEQGERFHQDVRDIERRYQGRWDVNMLADYCWMLRRETEDGKRKRVRRSVKEKKRFHRQKE